MNKLKKKSLVRWAGFVNNKLDVTKEDYSGYKIYAIFTNKKIAKLCYQDVRKITIEEIK